MEAHVTELLRLLSSALFPLFSCSGGLIMKAEMLCQRYCTRAIPFTLPPLTHTHTNRTEAGDAYPLADPTGIADTGLPFCYRLGGGREGESGKENKGQRLWLDL